MPDWSIPRGISSARRLANVAQSHGADRDSLLMGTGIRPATLDDPAAEITPEQELQMIRNVQA
ncbi:AraC family transcriptional regulator, partial [Acinetobacter baumannii]